ncbi:MAG: thiamine biosynthesis protein ThiJ [Proteobacteria bacterium]|nr:MAG: thiamine biosynthesis protein ThiJ [Pseudomonadota bacterium]
MKIAFVLYDRLTYLNFFGFYDVITRLRDLGIDENLRWKTCALKDEIKDDKGLRILPDVVGESLDGYDLVFIPGGIGARTLQYDDIFLSWIKSARNARCKVSVCTGALLFGAARLIKDKRATTSKNNLDLLGPYCKEVVSQRVVEDGDFISATGVSASLDLGLYVVEKFYGKKAKEDIANMMEYPLR